MNEINAVLLTISLMVLVGYFLIVTELQLESKSKIGRLKPKAQLATVSQQDKGDVFNRDSCKFAENSPVVLSNSPNAVDTTDIVIAVINTELYSADISSSTSDCGFGDLGTTSDYGSDDLGTMSDYGSGGDFGTFG